MKLNLYRYQPEMGWDTEPDPSLDSDQTRVIAFGAAEVAPIRQALEFLRQTYPSSVMTGCSTAGEIFEKELLDGSLVVEEDQSIAFAGDIPAGSRVRLMRANLDRLIGEAG